MCPRGKIAPFFEVEIAPFLGRNRTFFKIKKMCFKYFFLKLQYFFFFFLIFKKKIYMRFFFKDRISCSDA